MFCANRYTISQYCGRDRIRTCNPNTRATIFKTAWQPLSTLPFYFISICQWTTYFSYASIYEIYLRHPNFYTKKPESFFDPGFLLEFICYNYLYHIPVLVCFGSLLYAIKPKMTSPHNESDHVLRALVAVLNCWCMFCACIILF